jgi:very-short-patch-repair endonuclease
MQQNLADKAFERDAFVDHEHMSKTFRELRHKLLDFSARNPLVNFNHSETGTGFLRVIDEIPDELYASFLEQKLKFRPLPDVDSEPPDENTIEFQTRLSELKATDEDYRKAISNEELRSRDPTEYETSVLNAERELRNRIRSEFGLPTLQTASKINLREHAKLFGFIPTFDLSYEKSETERQEFNVQTLELPPRLDRKLRNIYQRYSTTKRESGINTLKLAFGFLDWTESESSDRFLHSPLLLLPVDVEKIKTPEGHEYIFTAEDPRAVANETIRERFKEIFGLELPTFTEDLGIRTYLSLVSGAVAARYPKWAVRSYVTLASFPSSTEPMRKDEDEDNWDGQEITSHPAVAALLGGKQSQPGSFIEDEANIDRLTLQKEAPPLVVEADASQHSAVYEVLKGSHLVIQGPPGTGKSQTITNLIASSVAKGGSVLFLAQKQPALNVVANRLRSVGLAPLMFEPQRDGPVHEFLKSLEERLNLNPKFDPKKYQEKYNELLNQINFTNRVKECLNQVTSFCELTVFECIWKYLKFRNECSEFQRTSPFKYTPENEKITHLDLERYIVLVHEFFDTRQLFVQPVFLDYLINLQPNELAINGFKAEIVELSRGVSHYEEISETIEQCISLKDQSPSYSEIRKCLSQLRKRPGNICSGKSAASEKLKNLSRDKDILKFLSKTNDYLSQTRVSEQGDLITLEKCASILGVASISRQKIKGYLDKIERCLACLPTIKSLTKLTGIDNITINQFQQLLRALPRINNDSDVEEKRLTEQQVALLKLINTSETTASISRVIKDFLGEFSEIKTKASRIGINDFSLLYEEWTAARLEAALAVVIKSGFFARLGSDYKEAIHALEVAGFSSPRKSETQTKISECIQLMNRADLLSDNGVYRHCFGEIYRGFSTPESRIKDIQQAITTLAKSSSTIARLDDTLDHDLKLDALLEITEVVEQCRNIDLPDNLDSDLSLERVGVTLNEDRLSLAMAEDALCKLSFSDIEAIDIVLAKNDLRIALSYIEGLKQFVGEETETLWCSSIAGLCFDASEALKNHLSIPLNRIPINEILEHVDMEVRKYQTELTILEELEKIFPLEEEKSIRRIYELELVIKSEDLHKFDETFALWHARYIDTAEQIEEYSIKQLQNLFKQIFQSENSDLITIARRRIFDKTLLQSDIKDFFYDPGFLTCKSASEASAFLTFSIVTSFLQRIASANHLNFYELTGSAILQNRDRFNQIDSELKKLEASKVLFCGSQKTIPRGVNWGPKKSYTDAALIWNEIGKKRGHLKKRELIQRAQKALLAMKPIWLMQPLSVSQLLPRERELFDLIIIDEASQMLPEYAIPSMLRGKQLVVVGDDQQMPPSDLFRLTSETSDPDEVEIDAESILDLASNRLGNSVSLRFHYRSRHHSLIAFSNKHFYRNRLEVVPSPTVDTDSLGIKHIKVEGSYKEGLNIPEANRVILEAKRCMSMFEEQSLGIVAMNIRQKEYIEEELYRLADTDPVIRAYFERWEGDDLQYPFITNLERVQGDERDIIIISTVYGQDENKKMYQRFPLINSSHGHRRLNVLFTRAKNRLVLVTSMNPSDIKLEEGSTRGKRILQEYIQYAATGRLEQGEESDREPDSDFEIFVAAALKDAGFSVVPQVGVRKFVIDIGVKHPSYPYGFLAGIECDGRLYHSSSYARDRDRIRQDILESLGWRIYRVWSTDWFADPDRETKKMIGWLNEHLKGIRSKQITPTEIKAASTADLLNDPQGSQNTAAAQESKFESSLRPEISGPSARSFPRLAKSFRTAKQESGDVYHESEIKPKKSGQRRTYDYHGINIEYFEPHPNSFEVWHEDRILGWIEKQIIDPKGQVIFQFTDAMKNVGTVTFTVTLNDGKDTEKLHKTIIASLIWICDSMQLKSTT